MGERGMRRRVQPAHLEGCEDSTMGNEKHGKEKAILWRSLIAPCPLALPI
jgi:hypothetical protein